MVPDAKSLKGNLKDYLNPSPYIESGHPRIKALAKEVAADQQQAWDKAQSDLRLGSARRFSTRKMRR